MMAENESRASYAWRFSVRGVPTGPLHHNLPYRRGTASGRPQTSPSVRSVLKSWKVCCIFLSLIFSVASIAPAEKARDFLREARILYLPFDGSFDAAEAGGRAEADVKGNPTFVEGKKGRAASFTDVANVQLGAEGNFDQAEGAVAMWIQPYWPNDDGVPHCFLEVPVGPELFTDGGFVITKGWSTGVMPNLSYFYNSPGHYHMSGGQSFEANEWVHLVYNWSASAKLLQLFWNGELIQKQKYEKFKLPPSSTGRTIVVGARLGGASIAETDKGEFYGHLPRAFPGVGGDTADAALDEVMIFNRPLTPAEAAHLAGVAPRSAERLAALDPVHVNNLEARLETPHIPFAKPLSIGPVHALFVCPVHRTGAPRDVVELAQRFDLDFSAVTTAYPWTIGYEREYFRMWKNTSPDEKIQEILHGLEKAPEVLVIGNLIYSKFPARLHQAILDRVKNGMGLVVPGPRDLPDVFEPLGGADNQGAASIVADMPISGLPEFFPGLGMSPLETAKKGVRSYRVGEGRVVVIRWTPEQAKEGDGFAGLAPTAAGGRWSRQYEQRYNYHLGLIAKSLLWASGKELRATWNALPVEGKEFDRSQMAGEQIQLSTKWAGKNGSRATVSARVKDSLGRVLLEEDLEVMLARGQNHFSLPMPSFATGLHYLEFILATDDGIENWATRSFRVTGPDEIIRVKAASEYWERGEDVSVQVEFRDPVRKPAKLVARLRDTNGRVYRAHVLDLVETATVFDFTIPVDRPTTLASYIEVELVRGGEVISYGDDIVYVPKRDFDEFLSVLWCMIPNEGVGQVALREIRKLGFDAVYHWGDQCGDFENDAMADLMPAQYCTRITLSPDARGWSTGMPGNGRLDPAWKEHVEKFKESVQASMPLGPPYYSLGDENFFQFGFGFSPYELEAYRLFLGRRYGTISRLNREYGSAYTSFADVPRLKESDAIDQDLIPALLDHRLGTEEEYALYHHDLVNALRELDPDARVGAEGSQAGNLERMLDGVQLWGPYGDGILLRSLRSGDLLASNWWAGLSYGPKDCTKLWTQIIRGFVNYHQFFCASHIDGAIFNIDYSLRPFFENFLPEWRQIHSGIALMLRDAEVVSQYPIAIHWSKESEHASFALKRLGTSQSARNTLAKTLDALSRDYRYVTSRQIRDDMLASPGADILFLPSSHCLDEATAGNIEEYVRDGGTVVADFIPSLNEFGRRLPEGRLDKMFGATCGGKTTPIPINRLVIDTEIGGHPIRLKCPRTIAHADLSAGDADVLVAGRDVPMMLVKGVGNGRVILLNFDLGRCSRQERKSFLGSLLRIAGAKPEYELVGAAPGTVCSVLRRGNLTLVGVIQPEEEPLPASVDWSDSSHVYDVRAGKYLGKLNNLAVPQGQRVHLFAMQDSPVDSIRLNHTSRVAAGDTMPIQIKIGFKDPSVRASDRLVRLDVEDPEGKAVPHYRKFSRLTGSRVESSIDFAFNDLPGRWTLRVTDVATGVSETGWIVLVN